MIFALDQNGIRIDAAPGRSGWCPGCGESLIARCGELRLWHWAHSVDSECDPWWEPETEWHRGWKEICDPQCVEVSFGDHRADVVAKDGAVIELQHSPIAIEEVRAREAFYGKMLWLLDGTAIRDCIRVELGPKEPRFEWAYGRPTWLQARAPIFIHGFTLGSWIKKPVSKTGQIVRFWKPAAVSSDVLQVRSLKGRPNVHGVGRVIPLEKFMSRLLPLDESIVLTDCLSRPPFALPLAGIQTL